MFRGKPSDPAGSINNRQQFFHRKPWPLRMDHAMAVRAQQPKFIYGENRAKFRTSESSLRGKRICVTGQISVTMVSRKSS